MPSSKTALPKERKFSLRVESDIHSRIEELAEKSGISTTEYLRNVILEAARVGVVYDRLRPRVQSEPDHL